MLKPGMTYAHEHIPIDLSEVKCDEDCLLDSSDLVIEELKKLYDKGVRNIISMTNNGMGRNIEYAQKIANSTKINIVQSTGYYQEAFLPIEVSHLSVTQLAEEMIKDIQVGIKNTSVKASVIGEIATSKGKWTDNELKVFDAAVIAHKETKCPISTHTSMGTLGLEQIHYLKRKEANLSQIVIGHADLFGNEDYILEMLKTGVNIAFDTIGKNHYLMDYDRIKMLKTIQNFGRIEQVVLSMDISRKSYLKYNGGKGYAYLLDEFVPKLLNAGITATSIEKMMDGNPQRIFC